MSDWHSTTLQEIISTIESGSRPKGGVRIGENSEGVPSYGGENISMSGGMLYDSVRMVPTNFATEMRRGVLSDKDVLINKDGANTGKSAIYRKPGGEEFATINEHLFLLRCNKDIADQEFLYHFLNSEHGKSQIARVITGSAQPGLNSTFPEFVRIDLPPLPEQKKIAEILSGIDKCIDLIKKKEEKLQTSAEAICNSWESLDIIFNDDIQSGCIGDLLYSIDSGWSPPCETSPPSANEWGILKVSAVTSGVFQEEESKRLPSSEQPRERCLVKKGDLLITRANGNPDLVGRGAIVRDEPKAKLMMPDLLLRLTPKKVCDRSFLLLLLNSKQTRIQVEKFLRGSTGAKKINQEILRSLSVRYPSMESQQKITQLLTSLSDTRLALHEKLTALISLKRSLSDVLLSGRKRVTI